MHEILQNDQNFIWHPFTQHAENYKPLVIEKAKGIQLFDTSNKAYFDTVSSWWCNILGHSHPKIVAAIQQQVSKLDHIIFAGFTHETASSLAKLLIDNSAPHLKKVFFSDNGSTSIEVAIKQSIQFWQLKGHKQKNKLACFSRGYHGDTIGCMSISGTAHFHHHFNHLCFESIHFPNPSNLYHPDNEARCLSECEDYFKSNHHQVAAVIIEPLMMAAGGMLPNSIKFLESLYALCKTYQIHLIVDEVAVGFGRTGSLFASDQTTIKADFMCLSKGLTNGTLPLATTLVTEDIFEAFLGPYESHTFFHGHTFSGNPIGCAAAIACITELVKPEIFEHISKLISKLKSKSEILTKKFPLHHSRQCGLIWAFDIELPHSLDQRFNIIIYELGLKHGILLRPLGNTVYLNLALITQFNQLEEIFIRIEAVLVTFFEKYSKKN